MHGTRHCAVQNRILRLPEVLRQASLQLKTDVRSIQRLPLSPGRDARWVAKEYFRWLPQFLSPLIRVSEGPALTWEFRLPVLKVPLLVLDLSESRSTPDRQLFYIRPGLLARGKPLKSGRLEFREVQSEDCVLAAIHDFSPRLHWSLYKYTQALVHLWVMRGFRRHLLAVKSAGVPSPQTPEKQMS